MEEGRKDVFPHGVKVPGMTADGLATVGSQLGDRVLLQFAVPTTTKHDTGLLALCHKFAT